MITLIISAIIFHLPFAIFKDSARRLDQMNKFNPNKANLYKYNEFMEYDNFIDPLSNPITKNPLFILSSISSLIFGLLPLLKLLDINWFFIVLLNIITAFFITPFLGFILISSKTIPNRKHLKTITYVSIIVGFILYFIN